MARKKSCECHNCKKKIYVENAVKLDDEEYPIYWCCDECRKITTDEEIITEKIYHVFKDILGVKALNKTVKGYIRNRLAEEYDDKREVLLIVLKARGEKITKTIAEKTFPNTTVKAKYVFACIKKDVEDTFKQNQKQYRKDDIEIPVSLTKTIIRKFKDISSWLN